MSDDATLKDGRRGTAANGKDARSHSPGPPPVSTEDLAEAVRDLIALQRHTSRRLREIEDFLAAVRREVNSFGPLRLARRLLFRRPAGPPPRSPASPWREDFLRVYSETECFDERGRPHPATERDRRNFLNHLKFYRFAAQFARGRVVLDAGCGSGYGCRELALAGAAAVHGCDLSEHALDYARRRHGDCASFTRQSCAAMSAYGDGMFDLVVCSEVLEHLREHGEEEAAMREIRRVARPEALLVLATPNVEMLPAHGFEYGELHALCERHFREVVVFENLLLPFEEDGRMRWLERKWSGETGLLAAAPLQWEETVLPAEARESEPPSSWIKTGRRVEWVSLGPYRCDARLLHNTHSFVVLATGRKDGDATS